MARRPGEGDRADLPAEERAQAPDPGEGPEPSRPEEIGEGDPFLLGDRLDEDLDGQGPSSQVGAPGLLERGPDEVLASITAPMLAFSGSYSPSLVPATNSWKRRLEPSDGLPARRARDLVRRRATRAAVPR